MIDHCDKCHQVHEECVCIDSTNGVFAKVREHEAEAKVARMEDALDKLFDAVGEDGCCEERADFWHAVAECCSLSPKARAALTHKEKTDE